MVFSFFKKKEKVPEERMPERPAARPKIPGVPGSAPGSASTMGGNVAANTPAAEPQALPDLEFSREVLPARPLVSASGPAGQAPVTTSGRPQESKAQPVKVNDAPDELTVSEFERNFTESSVMAINVDHGGDPVQADVEQIAVLFANGQDVVAKSLLDVFVRSYQGQEGVRFWRMYFDLLQVTGDRPGFDRLSLEFARATETSPPVWQENRIIHDKPVAEEAFFELQGVLTTEHGKSLVPILAALQARTSVRIGCNRLLACDDSFAAQLAAVLQRAMALGVPVQIEGGEILKSFLRKRMLPGEKSHFASWRLFFELLLRLGQQEEFEEMAVHYAVTFEQSPPSWVSPELKPAVAGVPERSHDAYYLSGDIKASKFDELDEVFTLHAVPVLDFEGVRRIDFFSAGQLANRLGIFKHKGREIIIRSPNHLVAELMGVVGINKYARILVPEN